MALYKGSTKISPIITVEKQPVISSYTVTPTTSQQTITAPSGIDGYSPITVNAVTSSIDSNISASNIKSGVTILGTTGTYTGSGGGGGDYNLVDVVSYESANEYEYDEDTVFYVWEDTTNGTATSANIMVYENGMDYEYWNILKINGRYYSVTTAITDTSEGEATVDLYILNNGTSISSSSLYDTLTLTW